VNSVIHSFVKQKITPVLHREMSHFTDGHIQVLTMCEGAV